MANKFMNIGDIVMNIDSNRLREDILEVIKQCTSYEFVNDDMSIDELQVDADFFSDAS